MLEDTVVNVLIMIGGVAVTATLLLGGLHLVFKASVLAKIVGWVLMASVFGTLLVASAYDVARKQHQKEERQRALEDCDCLEAEE